MTAANGFAIEPPIEPMLAKLAEVIPPGTGYLYEPKWDGFRAIVFRSGREVRGNYDLAVDDLRALAARLEGQDKGAFKGRSTRNDVP